ncbi:bifunctional monodehydroascorbate reductase and carbonic anhydrase nectarin-3 [Tanacetum coccineum]|uniref:Bifunctional monodehydroascorbate reductase and carbonic anhydrase nectarin-3 n=1 Tax=Tanacetum coccineum TaxID=301880 RepID=A0ABQ5DX62_9ASTR
MVEGARAKASMAESSNVASTGHYNLCKRVVRAVQNDVTFVFGDSTPIDGNALTEDTDGGVIGDVFSSTAEQTSLTHVFTNVNGHTSTASRNVSTPIESFWSTGEAEFVNVVPNQAATRSLQPTSPNAIGSNLNGASSVPNVDKVAAIIGVSITSLKDMDVLTRRIKAGDCNDSLDRLNKDERKVAMNATLPLCEKFLGARSDQTSSIPNYELPIVKSVPTNAKSDSYAGASGVLGRCDSWGRSSFARCMIEVNVDNVLKESITIGIPLFYGSGFSKEIVRVEYEWKPPFCEQCKIFGHVYNQCPKNAKIFPIIQKINNDGFQMVVNRRSGKTGSINNNRSGVNVRFEPTAHEISSKNGVPNVSTSAKDGHTKQPTKVVDIPSSSSAKKGEFDPENYKRSEDESKSEDEVEVVFDKSVNLLNSTKRGLSTRLLMLQRLLSSFCHVSIKPLLEVNVVRISQKSQENSQKQANTDTRIRRVQKEAKDTKPKPNP